MGVILRHCLRDSIPEIFTAAEYLDVAVTEYMRGNYDRAAELIKSANMTIIKEWTESLWGKNSPYVRCRKVDGVTVLPKELRVKVRMPTTQEKKTLHQRDGYHCRFCRIPIIRSEVRKRMQIVFPQEIGWSQKNDDCHSAFQAMWAQYDHLLPHSKGGNNELSNIVVTCAPCNFARMNYTLEEVGLLNPLTRESVASSWDGLEHFK